jgi:hypothetical protein
MQVYLRRVDLPPMLGPVTKSKDYSRLSSVSFGTNYFEVLVRETQGCLIYLMSNILESLNSPLNSKKRGLHMRPSD